MRGFFIGIFCLFLAAGAPRLPILMAPPGTPRAETSTVYVATDRALAGTVPGTARTPQVRRYRYTIRIPPEHRPGTLKLPNYNVNPATDFLATGAVEYPTQAAFIAAVRASLHALPPDQRDIFVYVHGFNNTFADGVLRLAQLDHDLGIKGVAAHFSWPSGANPLGYGYDRDSALYSRDALESFLRALAGTHPRRVVIMAHSLGAQLTMETLRQIEIATPGWSVKHLQGVALVSPDIDVDVFRSEVARIGTLPQPFAIFVSDRDRVLDLSARLSGSRDRLGNVKDPAQLADLKVTLIDTSGFSSGAGHFNLGDSSALLQVVSQLANFDRSFRNEGAGHTGFIPGTVLTVQNMTEVLLTPLAGGGAR